MSTWRVPLALPEITASDIEAVLSVLHTSRLSRGPMESGFEDALAAATNVRHAVAMSSGTAGLHACIRALGLQPGDEVITTPYSFVASANALLHERVTPVFVDVRPEDLNLDPARVREAITPRTRALLVVHVYGRPAPMQALNRIADRHGLTVIEDACEAIGSETGGRRCGGWGRAGVVSFYPNKQVTTGEGGAVLTDDAELADRLRLLRNQGRVEGGSAADQIEVGFSYRLPEMSCALGLSQLRRLSEVVRRRSELAAAYGQRLRDTQLRLPPSDDPGMCTSWFAYVVRLPEHFGTSARDRILEAMAAEGIQCGRYFWPIHLQPVFQARFGYRPGSFPVAEAAGRRCIALPFFNTLSEAQVELVCAKLRAFVQQAEPSPVLRNRRPRA